MSNNTEFRGEGTFILGHVEIPVEVPFIPASIEVGISDQHHHCGGFEQSIVEYEVERNIVTIIADIKGEYATVYWIMKP